MSRLWTASVARTGIVVKGPVEIDAYESRPQTELFETVRWPTQTIPTDFVSLLTKKNKEGLGRSEVESDAGSLGWHRVVMSTIDCDVVHKSRDGW